MIPGCISYTCVLCPMYWHSHAATLPLLFLSLGTFVKYCDGFMLSTSRIQPLRCDLHMAITVPKKDRRLDFGFFGRVAFSLLPLSPETAGRRKTIFTEVVQGKVWTLDQVRSNSFYRYSATTLFQNCCKYSNFRLGFHFYLHEGSRSHKRERACEIYNYSSQRWRLIYQ